MQLTFYTDYAFRVLLYLSRMPHKLSTTTEISEFYQIPKNHLVKVVHSLARLGFIISIRGKGGGIKLAKFPQDISIGEVIRMMEPNFSLVECFDREKNRCAITHACHLKGILNEAREAFFRVLDSYTLSNENQISFAKQISTHLIESEVKNETTYY